MIAVNHVYSSHVLTPRFDGWSRQPRRTWTKRCGRTGRAATVPPRPAEIHLRDRPSQPLCPLFVL